MVVANYSGWGPGQLDGELGAESWLTLPGHFEATFSGRAKKSSGKPS